MNLNNVKTAQDWTYYLSLINASSDPLDFLMSTDNNIPYKKFNRLKASVKNKKYVKHEQGKSYKNVEVQALE